MECALDCFGAFKRIHLLVTFDFLDAAQPFQLEFDVFVKMIGRLVEELFEAIALLGWLHRHGHDIVRRPIEICDGLADSLTKDLGVGVVILQGQDCTA